MASADVCGSRNPTPPGTLCAKGSSAARSRAVSADFRGGRVVRTFLAAKMAIASRFSCL